MGNISLHCQSEWLNKNKNKTNGCTTIPDVLHSLTLDGVGLARVGHAIGVEEAVLPAENVLHRALHRVLEELLLRGLRPKDLEPIRTGGQI